MQQPSCSRLAFVSISHARNWYPIPALFLGFWCIIFDRGTTVIYIRIRDDPTVQKGIEYPSSPICSLSLTLAHIETTTWIPNQTFQTLMHGILVEHRKVVLPFNRGGTTGHLSKALIACQRRNLRLSPGWLGSVTLQRSMTNPGTNGSMISAIWLSMNVNWVVLTVEGQVAYVIMYTEPSEKLS